MWVGIDISFKKPSSIHFQSYWKISLFLQRKTIPVKWLIVCKTHICLNKPCQLEYQYYPGFCCIHFLYKVSRCNSLFIKVKVVRLVLILAWLSAVVCCAWQRLRPPLNHCKPHSASSGLLLKWKWSSELFAALISPNKKKKKQGPHNAHTHTSLHRFTASAAAQSHQLSSYGLPGQELALVV